MSDQTVWESIKGEGHNLFEKLKELGAALAPVVAAIGALVALLKDCTIQVERER